MKALSNTLYIEHLHPEPRNVAGVVGRLNLLAEVQRLKRSLETAKQEIQFLSSERDELVRALRTWAGDAPTTDEERY